MILVTGGTGFIGTNLIKRLIRDDDVCCIDNGLVYPYHNLETLYNCDGINGHRFFFDKRDVCDLKDIKFGFEQLYHLACPASPVLYKKHPLEVLRTCTEGMFNLIDLCESHNAKLLYTSTSEVYGDAKVAVQSESYWGNVNPIGERSCYDEGKRCGESILINSNIDFSIARIFNTYGPHMYSGDGRVVSEFIKAAMYNRPLVINGNGSQTRSFCYVDDTVDGLIKLMNTPYKKPINIGNPNYCVTINRLAEKIIKITGSDSYIQLAAKSPDDPYRRKPDITLARDILQWEPEVSLDDGLRLTYIYYLANLKK